MLIKLTLPCLLLMLSVTMHSSAQTRIIDSLETELKKHPMEDTFRLNILNDLSYYFSSEDPERGLQFADQAIDLAKLLRNDRKLSTAYNNKGINYSTKGDDSLAIANYKTSMGIKEKTGDIRGIGVALHNIGIIYSNRSDYSNALTYQERAYEIFRSLGFDKGMASTLNSTGVVYLYLSDYPQSLEYYLKALKIYERIRDSFNIAIAFTNIGLVYDHSSQFEKALEYYSKAENILRRKQRQYELQNVLNNIGNTYDNVGQFTKALEYYDDAMQINKQLSNQRGIASGLVNAAIVYSELKDYHNAMNRLDEALKMYRDMDDKYGMTVTLSYLSKNILNAPEQVLQSPGINIRDRYTKAITMQKEALRLAIESGLLKEQSEAWDNLSTIYKATNEPGKALEAFQRHIELRDSVMNDDKKLEIARLSMQYDFDKKQIAASTEAERKHSIAMNALEKQKIIRNVTASAAIIIIFAAGISFIFYERKQKATAKVREAELRAEVADVEMKALRAQMNPHFIFNSLNSINDYISRNDIDTADRYLTKFSVLIRMILENSEHKEVSLEEDIKAIDLYMQLEQLRMKHKFDFKIAVDPGIDQSNTLIPPLILQPFVENSIWHGFAGLEGKGNILIQIKQGQEMLICSIEDNGVGFQENKTVNGSSFGMKITQARIQLLNKLKEANANFDVASSPDGTKVVLKLPLSLRF